MKINSMSISEIRKIYASLKSKEKISVHNTKDSPLWRNKMYSKDDEKIETFRPDYSYPDYNAEIGWDEQAYWYSYTEGFFQIAHNAIDLAAISPDTAVYPIIFNYRHYLELTLKVNLLRFQIYFREPISSKLTHDLDETLEKLCNILEKYNLEFFISDFQEEVINDFSKIDERNDRFRFIYDIKGELSHDYNHETINLRHLHIRMNKVYDEFSALNSLFDYPNPLFEDSLLSPYNEALISAISGSLTNKEAKTLNQIKGYLTSFKHTIEIDNEDVEFKFDKKSIKRIDNRTFQAKGSTKYGSIEIEIKTEKDKIKFVRFSV